MSRKILAILAVIVVVVIILFATGFWDVRQTDEGTLPDVDVSAEGGAPQPWHLHGRCGRRRSAIPATRRARQS